MRQRLSVHLTWTTRDRDPMIEADAAALLRHLLPAIARQERARIVESGMVRTNVHLLVQLHSTTPIPRLVPRFINSVTCFCLLDRIDKIRLCESTFIR